MCVSCHISMVPRVQIPEAEVLSARFPKEYDHKNLQRSIPSCVHISFNTLFVCDCSIHMSIHTSIHASTHTCMHACIHIRKFRHGCGMRRVPSKTTKLGETFEKCLKEQAPR